VAHPARARHRRGRNHPRDHHKGRISPRLPASLDRGGERCAGRHRVAEDRTGGATLVVTDALSETYLPALKRLGVDVYVG